MVTINEALELIKAGFSVDDIRAMDSKPAEEKKPEQEQKPAEEKKPEQEQKSDPRIDALTASVEKLVDVVGKMPFFASMGTPSADADADSVLASIINPPTKEK